MRSSIRALEGQNAAGALFLCEREQANSAVQEKKNLL